MKVVVVLVMMMMMKGGFFVLMKVAVSVCGGDGGVSGDCVCMCVRGGKFKFVCA